MKTVRMIKTLQLTASNDFASTLDFVILNAKKIKSNRVNWKFFIISFYNLLQSAMINYISLRSNTHVYKKTHEKQITEVLKISRHRRLTDEDKKVLANLWVDDIANLYKKCRNKEARPQSEKKHLIEIKWIRNGLEHYDGNRWTMHYEFILNLIRNNIGLLKYIVGKISSDSSRWDYELAGNCMNQVSAYNKMRMYYENIHKKIETLAQLVSDQ